MPAPALISRDALVRAFADGSVRAYTVWPTRNVFFCRGRLMTGPPEDVGPNLCAWTSILMPIALFFYAWGPALLDEPPPYVAVVCTSFFSTVFWLAVTSFTDPGIVPRGPKPDKDPPYQRTRVDEGGDVVTDTWCHTCSNYRPPGASHCSDCDNCVRGFDHHCPFTRNCIGERNYGPFVMFLVSICLSLSVILLSLGLVFPSTVAGSAHDPERMRGKSVAMLLNSVLASFSVVMAVVMFAFTGYHLSLICAGLTTKEHLKKRSAHARKGCFQRLCGCATVPSEIAPRSLVPRSGMRALGTAADMYKLSSRPVPGRATASSGKPPIISHTQL